MEYIIITALLFMIMLLLQDRVKRRKHLEKQALQDTPSKVSYDILGKTSPSTSSFIRDHRNKKESKIDFHAEQEALQMHCQSLPDSGFTHGATFQDLSIVQLTLKKDKPSPAEKNEAVAILQKIQGTELVGLLESSMENASVMIAELLDSRLPVEPDDDSSLRRKAGVDDFDINAFL